MKPFPPPYKNAYPKRKNVSVLKEMSVKFLKRMFFVLRMETGAEVLPRNDGGAAARWRERETRANGVEEEEETVKRGGKIQSGVHGAGSAPVYGGSTTVP